MDESFLDQAFVYLLAAVASVPIAKRLGLGSVLGYLAAGVIIGPFALSLVGAQTDVLHFAEFGVVMMLFLIGLERRPALLWRMRRAIFGVGGSQVAVTTVAIAIVGVFAGLAWQTAFAIGLTLSLSSTAIVLQSLEERGLRRTSAGQGAFSVLLFQDIAVIPMLAVLPALALPGLIGHGADAGHGGESSLLATLPAWAGALAVLGAVALIVFGGRFLSRPLFRMIAKTRLRELFTASALLLVVAIALLMETVGLSPALGTFLAGVVLADSEFRHELETDVEPFKGLLLGLFFISVGASIDFAIIFAQPGLILGLVAALVVGKFALTYGVARAFRIKGGDGLLVAAALAQGGEFGFVLIAFSLQSGVLSTDLASLVTAVVAISMATTPLLLIAHERLVQDRGAPSQQDREPDVIDEHNRVVVAGFGRFGQIVVRLLNANRIDATVLDHSPDQIDLVRRFGGKAYYGDASRADLLKAAGLGPGKLLVIAVDDRDTALSIAETARTHFPDVTILARAYDRRHAYQLMKYDVATITRETFGSALLMGVEALKQLGFETLKAERAGRLFRKHDEETVRKLADHWGDDAAYGIALRQRVEDLAQVMELDGREDRAKDGSRDQ